MTGGRVVLIFVDGVGLGAPDPARNPMIDCCPRLAALVGPLHAERSFPVVSGRACLGALDAALGVPGLPQSATGQVSLLTGRNAALMMGRHINAHPPQVLRELLASDGLFARMRELGHPATFANAFRPDSVVRILEGRYRSTATTAAVLGAGMSVRTFDDLACGRAVTHDITGWSLRRAGLRAPRVAPERAAHRLADLAADYRFTLFEHFLTDIAGHAADRRQSCRVLDILDRFAVRAAAAIDPIRDTLLLTSDHGNIEDERTRGHTLNPVPLLAVGRRAAELVCLCRAITDVAPAILDLVE